MSRERERILVFILLSKKNAYYIERYNLYIYRISIKTDSAYSKVASIYILYNIILIFEATNTK